MMERSPVISLRGLSGVAQGSLIDWRLVRYNWIMIFVVMKAGRAMTKDSVRLPDILGRQ